jgi:PhzF family phenazine biosynthesis protein
MRAYKVVDAFSSVPFKGNPVAVVLDAAGLSTSEMQAIARWTNLSETTFLLPPTEPGADYHLRIFTPRSELPFAGHPTLGSAHAALEAGIVTPKDDALVQQCGQGLVRIAVDGEGDHRQLTLELPSASITPLADADVDELEAIVGQRILREVTPAIIDVGAVWVVAQLADAASLLAAEPDFARSARFERRLGVTGLSLFGRHGPGSGHEIEVRSFAPSCGVDEDPVCGSGNGSIAVLRATRGLLPKEGAHYVAAQGQKVGRDGRINISVDSAGRVTVGGACVTSVDGVLRTPQSAA